METKFQTSFIPKKSMAPIGVPGSPSAAQHHKSSSLFMTIGTLAFLLSLAAAGGSYAWKHVLTSSQQTYKEQLALREQQFNIDLIEQLKQVNIKIDLAKRLVQNHLATSQIFDIISRMTIDNVRFLSMTLAAPTPQSSDVKITMRGYGTSFSAVAFQSDVLAQLEQYGLRKVVKNPILSDPALDSAGTVSFNFSASIDANSLSYQKSVSGVPAVADPSAADQSAATQ